MRPVIIAAAIVVLFTKITLAAWATSDAPGPMLDAFGNPLCLVDMGAGRPDDKNPSMPNCCVLGCGQGLFWSPTPLPIVGIIRDSTVLRATTPRLPVFEVQPHEHTPGFPRAPPALGI